MGRLSDAWNRAEAESLEVVASSTGTVCEPDLAQCPAPSATPTLEDTSAAEARGFSTASRGNQPGAFPREWSPDPHRLVFLNGNGNGSKRHESVAQHFRAVSSQLYKIRQVRPISSILVSSAMSKEGRSFVAANLSHALAQQPDKHVLLIDGDMRKPALHDYFGASAEPGLSDYLAGRVDAGAVIQRGPIRGLFFVPSGGATIESAELLANGRLKALIKRAARFDWIVIDSPATSVACDASIMADACDGVLLVVQATKTPAVLAERAVQQFAGRPILGAIVNRSDLFRSYRENAR
jgi:protein-tyrosine kinase